MEALVICSGRGLIQRYIKIFHPWEIPTLQVLSHHALGEVGCVMKECMDSFTVRKLLCKLGGTPSDHPGPILACLNHHLCSASLTLNTNAFQGIEDWGEFCGILSEFPLTTLRLDFPATPRPELWQALAEWLPQTLVHLTLELRDLHSYPRGFFRPFDLPQLRTLELKANLQEPPGLRSLISQQFPTLHIVRWHVFPHN